MKKNTKTMFTIEATPIKLEMFVTCDRTPALCNPIKAVREPPIYNKDLTIQASSWKAKIPERIKIAAIPMNPIIIANFHKSSLGKSPTITVAELFAQSITWYDASGKSKVKL